MSRAAFDLDRTTVCPVNHLVTSPQRDNIHNTQCGLLIVLSSCLANPL